MTQAVTIALDKNGVATVTLSQPKKHNVLNETSITALGAALEPDSLRPYVLFTLQINLLSSGTTSVTVSNVGKLNDDSGADIVVAQRIPGSVIVD